MIECEEKSFIINSIKLEDFVKDYIKNHKYFSNNNISINYILDVCGFSISDFKKGYYKEKLPIFRKKLNYDISFIIKRLKEEGFVKIKQYNTKTFKVIQ